MTEPVQPPYRTPADSPHEDERQMWAALLAGELPRDAGARLDIPFNRVRYLCRKWANKGFYDWGVTHDLGWPVLPRREEERA